MKKYNPNIHHRRSIRLKGYDYSQSGLYFITICTQNRQCLLGEISEGKMILNNAGKMVENCWYEIPAHFPNIKLHHMVVMPNHFHGIIEIVGANKYSPHEYSPRKMANNHSPHNHLPDNGVKNTPPDDGAKNVSPDKGANNNSPQQSGTIGSVVRGFKIGVSKWFRKNYPHQYPVGQPVWQRNYYEHIIRNANEYQRIAQYIINNPQKWENDKLNFDVGNTVLEPTPEYVHKLWMIE